MALSDRLLGPGGVATVPAVHLIVARCEGRHTGRLTATLPEALRLLMVKSDEDDHEPDEQLANDLRLAPYLVTSTCPWQSPEQS